MKTGNRKRKNIIKKVFFALTLTMPMLSMAQNNREIRDFYKSFTNTYNINLDTNTNSETISDFTSITKFNIDKNGEGTIDFEMVGFKSTLVKVDYSQIQTLDKMTYWNFGCTHSERPEKIQMTLEINPETNTIKSFVVYNEGKEKAYVFF